MAHTDLHMCTETLKQTKCSLTSFERKTNFLYERKQRGHFIALVPTPLLWGYDSSHNFGRSLNKLGRLPCGITFNTMKPLHFSNWPPMAYYTPPPPFFLGIISSHNFGRSSTKFGGLSFGTRVAIEAPLVFQNWHYMAY